MTTRLYYTDAMLLDFDAAVESADDGRRRVYLDRTAFYPTSGGQPHDTGTLAGVAVTDVVDEGERIAHVLAAPLPEDAGPRVRGTVDAARRRDHMQQHSGQHLLSAIAAELFGATTLSVHFGPDTSLIEVDLPAMGREAQLALERRANEIVREARPVTISFEDAGTARALRKAASRGGTMRIVTIAALDRSACGGTHVATTAEVGPVIVTGAERLRQHARIAFLCGDRALARARADRELLDAAAQVLSTAPAELPAIVAAQADRLRALDNGRKALVRALGEERAQRLHAAAPATNGLRIVTERTTGSLDDVHRETAQAITVLPACLYVATAQSPPAILVATSTDSGIEAGTRLRGALASVGGRGGGSARVAQGTADVSRLEQVVTLLVAAPR